jgi:hypothetical protein
VDRLYEKFHGWSNLHHPELKYVVDIINLFLQFKTQNENGGKCGICGDAYNLPQRPHEAPGKFATGIIVRSYVPGQVKYQYSAFT